MSIPSVVFFGDFSEERIPWNTAASHLGWAVQCAPDLNSLARISKDAEVTAVFVDQRTYGVSDALLLRRVRAIVPQARLIICCPIRFVFDVDPDEVGAFHVIARPLKIDELRASIGFVWESWSRRNEQNVASAAA